MDIAITGSTGLIGTRLGAALRADGHRVIAVVRPGSRTPEGAARTIAWDPSAGTIDQDALVGLDAVVHLAGEGIGDKRWTDEQMARIIDSRVQGTTVLAEALAGLDGGPKVLVSGSAIGFYGDRHDEVLTEASPPGSNELFLTRICTAWEAAAQPAIDAGIRVAFARTGIVLTPDGGALQQLLPLFKLGVGGRMGSGKQWMSWISIDDEIAALQWLLDHDISGPVNIVAPHPVTNAELASALGDALHRPSFLPVPAFGPRLLKGRQLADELLFASQRVLPTVLESSGYPFRHRTLPEALSALLA